MKIKIDKLIDADWNHPSALFLFNRDGGFFRGNFKTFFEKFGYRDVKINNLEELVDILIFDQESKHNFYQKFQEVSAGNLNLYEFDTDISYGESFHYHITFSSLEDLVGIHFGDATKSEKAKLMDRDKHEMDLDIIHALKNALLAKGNLDRYIQKYMDKGDFESAQRLMNSVVYATNSAVSYADTLQCIEKAETGEAFKWDNFLYREKIVEPVISLLLPKISKKRATFSREMIKNDTFIYGDKNRLLCAFFHLIYNALDHAEDGLKISAGYESVVSEEEEIGKRLTLWNTNSYIPPEIFEKIFEKGYGRGTGRGLSRVKKIVDEHHGKISVESGTNGLIETSYTKFIIELYNRNYLYGKGAIKTNEP